VGPPQIPTDGLLLRAAHAGRAPTYTPSQRKVACLTTLKQPMK